jgi:hypothetical protein
VSLKVQRLDASNDLAMREVGDDASESREVVEDLDAKTGLCPVDVQVCRSGIHCSRDVCQLLLGHDSAPALLSVDDIRNNMLLVDKRVSSRTEGRSNQIAGP